MKQINYPLQWLDWAVMDILRPQSSHPPLLSEAFCQHLTDDAALEAQKQQQLLRSRSFELMGKAKNHFFKTYHLSLVLLYEQSLQNQRYWQANCQHASLASKSLTECISSILNAAEFNLHGPPPTARTVTSVDFENTAQQLLAKLRGFIEGLSGGRCDQELITILSDGLAGSLAARPGALVRESDLSYRQALASQLSLIQIHKQPQVNQENIANLLIQFNFNTPDFMQFYINDIARQVEPYSEPDARLRQLLWHQKEFSQISVHPHVAFDGRYPSLKKTIGAWFRREIHFIRLQEQPGLIDSAAQSKPFKVLCFLSVDQIAILLRSMDALRIFQAKSLNVVMHSIAPYLSTPVKAEISGKSLRSKSYSIEETDRNIVIQTLQSMIKWIEEY